MIDGPASAAVAAALPHGDGAPVGEPDAVTGAELSSTPVLSAPYDEADPKPSLHVAGTRAYVADPAGNDVIEIDYRDNGRVARTFDFDFTPASIGVVGS